MKSLLSLGTRKKPVDEEVDDALDQALQRLAEATEANADVCKKVRKRQSSDASLKLVSVPPKPSQTP